MTMSPWFWNRLAKFYSKQAFGNEAAYQEKLRLTREHLTPDSQVLEIACGTGGTARLHAPYVGHIRAVDFSSKMIAIARERQTTEGVTGVDFEVSSIEEIKEEPIYDVVMGMSIFHLLPNRRQVIEKCHGLLKPGGVFITSTTCITGPAFLRVLVRLLSPLRILPTVQFMTAEDLQADMRDAGFEIIEHYQPSEKEAMFLVARKS